MGENIIKSICWDITSRCNECCGFCYRNQNNKELNLESNKIILKKLIDFGVDKISFVGGEPFLYKDLFELLKWGKCYAKNKTLFSVTTNAILLTNILENNIIINKEMIQEALELFEWIKFSLDAPNQEIQSMMGRNSSHVQRIITILEYFNVMDFQNKVKINTVVSAININQLLELYKLLVKYNIKRWKIFRFLPSRGNALENREKYYISENDFFNIIQTIKNNNEANIKISVNGYDNFNNSYIMISSEGKLVIYDKDSYINCVNLLHEDVNNILKYVDINGNVKNRSDFLHV